MPMVIVSASTFIHGEEVAARAAELLQYRLVVRDEVVEAAARAFGSTPAKLIQAIDEPASLLPMGARERRIRLAAIQAALADHLIQGDCVCHGLAAHLYVTGISHVLKVRLTAPLDARIAVAAEQENVTPAKARKLILSRDKRRRRWVSTLFELDEDDPARFDLVIARGETGCDDDAARIAETARQRKFAAMTYSLKQARDYALSSKVRATLVDVDPEVVVRADDGSVHVEACAVRKNSGKAATLREKALAVHGVERVEVEMIDDVLAKAAMSMR